MSDLFALSSLVWGRPKGGVEIVLGRDLESPDGEIEPDEQYLYYTGPSHELVTFSTEIMASGRIGQPVQWKSLLHYEWYDLGLLPCLYREFSETHDSAEACAEFASEFGFLYHLLGALHTPKRHWEATKARDKDSTALGQAESVSHWGREIRKFKTMIGLWDGLQAHDAESLHRVLLDSQPYFSSLRHNRERFGNMDVAVSQRQQALSVHGRLDPSESCWMTLVGLLSDCVDDFGFRFDTAFSSDKVGDLAMHLPPSNLYTAMVFQLIATISCKKDFRQCKVCGTWFELHPDRARTDKLFCTGACRFKAYRQRQASAYVMHGQGKSIEAIANELGTSAVKVEEWIAKKTKQPARSVIRDGES